MTFETRDVPVVVLAGGMGARFDHESQVTPKPMITLFGKPILQHIIDSMVAQGFRRFIVLTGYLHEQIDAYFGRKGSLFAPWSYAIGGDSPYVVETCFTGDDSNTGRRVAMAQARIGHRRFVLTYGDGLADVDMAAVIRQHEESGAGVTLTAVRPPGRFGVLSFAPSCSHEQTLVESFYEKSSSDWINGGFMVVEPEFVQQYIEGEFELESTALVELAASGGLHAYRHEGYWRCMDTRRDRDQIIEDVRRSNDGFPWTLKG